MRVLVIGVGLALLGCMDCLSGGVVMGVDGWPRFDGSCRAGPARPAATVTLGSGERLPPDSSRPALVDGGENGVVKVRYSGSRLQLDDHIQAFPELGPHAWKRTLVVANVSDAPVDITGARLEVQPDVPEDAAALWQHFPFRMIKTLDGSVLCASRWNTAERADLRGTENGGFSLSVGCAWRLEPGQSARIGQLDVWLAKDDHVDVTRREARRWYAAHGLGARIVYPEWVYSAIFYEASAGGHIDSRFSDVGGFDAFARQIPYLAELGINGMWLNAVQTHKSGDSPLKGWNHYAPRNQLEIDPVMGGVSAFRRLAETMASRGMHLITEVVPHGGRCAQAAELPEWHTRDRNGKLRGNWGGFGMDNASPEWQQVLRRSMRMVADAGAAEGVRIDVALGQGANWGSPRTAHASYSTVGACLELMGALRDGLRSPRCPIPIMLPESRLQPEFFSVPGTVVLGYGWEFWMTSRLWDGDLLKSPHLVNARLREFFENERGSLPPGALVLRTLNNHDTVCHQGRAAFRFGVGLQRALYGVMLSVPGVPMMYQEEEKGSFFALRKLNLARRKLPQLAAADAVFPAAGMAHRNVFMTVRSGIGEPVICLVNLSGEQVVAGFPVPAGFPPGVRTLHDAVSGRSTAVSGGAVSWTMAPYATAFLTTRPLAPVAPPDVAIMLPPRRESGAGRRVLCAEDVSLALGSDGEQWQLEVDQETGVRSFRSDRGVITVSPVGDGVLQVTGRMHTDQAVSGCVLSIAGSTRWAVSGRTALLEDYSLRRHYSFPDDSAYAWRRNHSWGHMPWKLYRGISPSGRLWQSLVEPLHPEFPVLAFANSLSHTLLLEDFETDAMNVVLTTAADERGEPEGLELRLLGIDTDLAAAVQHFGRGQPWVAPGLEPVTEAELTFSFSLRSLVNPSGMASLLDAPRLSFDPSGADLAVDAPKQNVMEGRIFLPEPGVVSWENLAPVDGTYEIELELRLSERSETDRDLADAYDVSFDGVPLPLRWVGKTTWSVGNAFFSKARIGPVRLGGGRHSLAIATRHTWCALTPKLGLIHPDQ